MNRQSQIGLLVVLLTVGMMGTSCPSSVIPFTFTLTVDSGTGSGTYVMGSVVTITADPPLGGFDFDEWTGNVATISNVEAATTTVTMYANLTVTATYHPGNKPCQEANSQDEPR